MWTPFAAAVAKCARGSIRARTHSAFPASSKTASGAAQTKIRTDHDPTPSELIRQAPEGKEDPRQKKEGGKGQQNNN